MGRKEYEMKLKLVAAGKRLKSYSDDTINTVNLCAQFVRQTVEDCEEVTPNTWKVAAVALIVARERGRSMRWAVDYEEAGRRLGLAKSFNAVKVGDVGYWEYDKWGHTAIYAGDILGNGVNYWLENTNAKNRKGGRRVFGATNAVWLTPATTLGTPRTLIAPTASLVGDSPAATSTKLESILRENVGMELWIIKGGGSPQKIGTIEKASEIDDKKVFIKVKE